MQKKTPTNLKTKNISTWVTSSSLALSLIYSLLFLARSLGDSFFILSKRSMIQNYVNSSLFSTSFDSLLWAIMIFLASALLFYNLSISPIDKKHKFFLALAQIGQVALAALGILGLLPLIWATLLLVVSCFFFSKIYLGISPFSLLKRLLTCVFLILLFVELGALFLVNVPRVLNMSLWQFGYAVHWNQAELSISNIAYPFLPYGYMLFFALGIVGFAVKLVSSKRFNEKPILNRISVTAPRFKSWFEYYKWQSYELFSGRISLFPVVLISVLISVLFVVITVLPWINPTYMVVSVDGPAYYNWLASMHGRDFNGAMSLAFANDRTGFLVLSYFLSFVFTPLNVVQLAAALLISLFVVVSLLFLRLFKGFRNVWIYGVMLVPFSFQALGLIYSGYFANMLALIFVFVYFVVFFKSLSSWSSLWFFVLLGTSLLVLFSHPWTWFVFAFSLGAFLLLEWSFTQRNAKLDSRFKLKATIIGTTIIVGLLVDFARKMLSPLSSTVSVFQTAQTSLSIPNASIFFNGLATSVRFDLGGVLANQLLIFLSIMGFLFLLTFRSEVANLLISWICVSSVIILLASADFMFNRFLFLMPSIVLSSLGLYFLVSIASKSVKSSKRWKMFAEILILALVFSVLLNFALHYVSNISVW